MKLLVIFAWVGFLSAACSKYQYLDFAATQNEILPNGIYQFENDSIKFVYKFSGQNTIVTLTIENKTAAPIFIDWRHSGLVYNGRSIQLDEDKTVTTTVLTRVPANFSNENKTVYSLENTIQNRNMLLPTAMYRNDSLVILRSRAIDIKENPPSSFHFVPDDEGNVKRQVHVYNSDQSPMRFQFFFTIKYGISQQHNVSYAHPFYLRYMEESKRRPSANTANQSYILRQ